MKNQESDLSYWLNDCACTWSSLLASFNTQFSHASGKLAKVKEGIRRTEIFTSYLNNVKSIPT